LFATTLREYEVARSAIARGDRLIAVGRLVKAIMTSKTTIPVFVSGVVGLPAPVGLHFGKKSRDKSTAQRLAFPCSCGHEPVGNQPKRGVKQNQKGQGENRRGRKKRL